MPITQFSCPSCEAVLSTRKESAPGTRVKCPSCGVRLYLPNENGLPARPRDEADTALDSPSDAFSLEPKSPRSPRATPPPKARGKTSRLDERSALARDEDTELGSPARKRLHKPRKRHAQKIVLGGMVALAVTMFLGGIGFVAWMVWWQDTSKPVVERPTTPEPDPAEQPGQPVARPPLVRPVNVKPIALADWHQDLEAAKGVADREKKDLLILFNGSDWCPACMRLAKDVLSTPQFAQHATQHYVLVHVDFPRKPPATNAVKDKERNDRLSSHFQIDSFPTVVLADAQARPYAYSPGYQGDGFQGYVNVLTQLQGRRRQRDNLLQAVETAQGLPKLEAARRASDYFAQQGFLPFYRPLLQEWVELARTHDPKNQLGHLERFFLTDWMAQLTQAGDKAAALALCADSLEQWSRKYRAQNPDRIAGLFMQLGSRLGMAGNQERAIRCFQAGLDAKPTDQVLVQILTRAAKGRLPLSSGTGFAVASGGYIMTNHHVVDGPGRLMVQMTNVAEPVPARVIASDAQRDMALLQIELPAAVPLAPLRVAGKKEIARGEDVVVLGYPLYESLGTGLKLTRGQISGLPEANTNQMILLDVRVNPGNSGGPLCDSSGNVIGMVSAKSARAQAAVESYGLALPGAEVDGFLLKHLPSYKQLPAGTDKLEWKEVDKQVSPSVVTVLKVL